jgi:hypothetical protein
MILIVDIDHTVSDAAWRDPLIGDWQNYHDQAVHDKPIAFVRELVTIYSVYRRYDIVAVTGRPEWNRGDTVRWLWDHQIPIDDILMRGQDDHRPAPEVKADLIRLNVPDLSAIAFVLEDRDDCVAAYRQMGLNVLQVYSGVDHGRDDRQARSYPAQNPVGPGERAIEGTDRTP